jgi:hypothetical protein
MSTLMHGRSRRSAKAVEKADAGGPFVKSEDATRYLDALARGDNPKPPRTFRAR